MAIESDEDRDSFLVDDSVEATFGSRTFAGLLDRPYVSANPLEQEVDGATAALVVKSADADGIANGARLLVDGSKYEVLSVQPDGTGMTTLVLGDP